jgi:hypothetical protein
MGRMLAVLHFDPVGARERRTASRAKPNNRYSHRQSKSNRTTKHDHDIEKQTLS